MFQGFQSALTSILIEFGFDEIDLCQTLGLTELPNGLFGRIGVGFGRVDDEGVVNLIVITLLQTFCSPPSLDSADCGNSDAADNEYRNYGDYGDENSLGHGSHCA